MLAGCGSTRTVTVMRTVTAPAQALGGGADQSFYGRLVAVQQTQGGYFVRFDPAWWLGGVTANLAYAHSMSESCEPRACGPVPNDYFVLDESNRTLTFFLPRATHGTVLTRSLTFPGTRVSADRLMQLMRQGAKAKLYEPLDSGVWLRVHSDTITSFAQQYRP